LFTLPPLHLFDSDNPPHVFGEHLRIDSFFAFFSRIHTATCTPFSSLHPKDDNTITVHVKCSDCDNSIFTVSFLKATSTFTINLSYLCPHQPWIHFQQNGKQNIYYSPPGIEFNQFPIDHPVRRFGKYLDSNGLIDQIYLPQLRQYIWSESKQYDIETAQVDESNLIDMLKKLPGIVNVTYCHSPAFDSVADVTKLDDQ
jgi:hypothetical protein